MNNAVTTRDSERGSAATKFLFTLAVLILLVHAGINYVPVAYEAESLKSEMHTAVVQGLAMPGKMNPVDNVKTRIIQAAKINEVPNNAYIDVKQIGTIIQARVAYNKTVNVLPFGMYRYNYAFDHTATPSGFLLKQ